MLFFSLVWVSTPWCWWVYFPSLHSCKFLPVLKPSKYLLVLFYFTFRCFWFIQPWYMTKSLKYFPVGETEWFPEPDFIDDMYWSGSAPLCVGGCRARHQELRRDPCGDSSCCWLGYKSLCRGETTRHQPEPLKHRKPSHLSRSYFLYVAVNCGRPDVDYNGMVYGNDWWVGSVVRYACRSGFMLVGSPTRSCQPNGLWTPKPLCLREFKELQRI